MRAGHKGRHYALEPTGGWWESLRPRCPAKVQHDLGDQFAAMWQRFRSEPCEREYRFAPPRRWRFDVAFPEHRVAVELEGAVWSGGRHTRGVGYVADMAKYNAAVLGGWAILRYTSDDLKKRPVQVMEEVASLLRKDGDEATE
jgi:very-short-patch-repair endonuclease